MVFPCSDLLRLDCFPLPKLWHDITLFHQLSSLLHQIILYVLPTLLASSSPTYQLTLLSRSELSPLLMLPFLLSTLSNAPFYAFSSTLTHEVSSKVSVKLTYPSRYLMTFSFSATNFSK